MMWSFLKLCVQPKAENCASSIVRSPRGRFCSDLYIKFVSTSYWNKLFLRFDALKMIVIFLLLSLIIYCLLSLRILLQPILERYDGDEIFVWRYSSLLTTISNYVVFFLDDSFILSVLIKFIFNFRLRVIVIYPRKVYPSVEEPMTVY